MFDELAERSLMDETYVCKASHNYLLSNSCTFFFKFVNGILRNWESLCDIRPDCHHHFDASGTSNAMFDELAERSLMSPLAGTKHTYVRLAIIIYCHFLHYIRCFLRYDRHQSFFKAVSIKHGLRTTDYGLRTTDWV